MQRSETTASHTAEPVRPPTISTADDFIEAIRESTRLHQESVRNQQQVFQIGKPPQDDEQVFGTNTSVGRYRIASPGTATAENQVIIPIQLQVSPAERRHLVQGVDAQTYYPPEACVFVAK